MEWIKITKEEHKEFKCKAFLAKIVITEETLTNIRNSSGCIYQSNTHFKDLSDGKSFPYEDWQYIYTLFSIYLRKKYSLFKLI